MDDNLSKKLLLDIIALVFISNVELNLRCSQNLFLCSLHFMFFMMPHINYTVLSCL